MQLSESSETHKNEMQKEFLISDRGLTRPTLTEWVPPLFLLSTPLHVAAPQPPEAHLEAPPLELDAHASMGYSTLVPKSIS